MCVWTINLNIKHSGALNLENSHAPAVMRVALQDRLSPPSHSFLLGRGLALLSSLALNFRGEGILLTQFPHYLKPQVCTTAPDDSHLSDLYMGKYVFTRDYFVLTCQ